MDTKVSPNRQKKEQLVADLTDKMTKAQALVFTNYQGLTHKQIEELKKAIKPAEGEFLVAKNSLILRSLQGAKVKIEDESLLEGPTGTLMANGDVMEPLKHLAKAIKDFGLPTVKFGYFEGKIITADEVMRLSALPSREILIAQLVGGMKSPLFGLHRALSWNIQKLVMTLKEIEKTKPQTAVDAAPATNEPAEESEAVPPTEPAVIPGEQPEVADEIAPDETPKEEKPAEEEKSAEE